MCVCIYIYQEIINPDEPDVLPETFTRLVLHGAYSDQFISHKEYLIFMEYLSNEKGILGESILVLGCVRI
jgi:hypothetical protein